MKLPNRGTVMCLTHGVPYHLLNDRNDQDDELIQHEARSCCKHRVLEHWCSLPTCLAGVG